MKKIFSFIVLILFAEQFCFATILNSSDTITIVKKEFNFSVNKNQSYNTQSFHLTYFEFDSLPIPLRDSIKQLLKNCLKDWQTTDDTTFDVAQVAHNFINSRVTENNNYAGTFTITAETKNHLSIDYCFFTEGKEYKNAQEYFTFNKFSGKLLQLIDIIKHCKMKKFKKLDLRLFREDEKHMDASCSTGENLYSSLHSTFFIRKDGIFRLFYGFDAAHCQHFFGFLIPKKELKPLLRKNFEW
jgi:hypothetical protein